MDPTTKPVQSAELPIMPDAVVKLVNMLDEKESMEAIWRTLVDSDMVTEIGNVACLRDKKAMVLLHSMSREMLRSVLLKTLGPDLYSPEFNSKKNCEKVLGLDGPGAYVVFIHIRGRQGRFLCAKEIKELIEHLRTYAKAVEAYQSRIEADRYGSSQFSSAMKDAMLQAMIIDNAEATTEPHDIEDPDYGDFEPRFGSKLKEQMAKKGKKVDISENIKDFIKMLEKRCLPGVDESVYQKQSPMMVGNAGRMTRRVDDHVQGTSLGNTAKLWGLLLSCLRVMGLDYEVRCEALFRAWDGAEQVNLAEVLGTVLAGSMVSVDGCNVKQPGTRAEGRIEDFQWEKSRNHVFAAKDWFRVNSKYSMDQRNKDKKQEIERLKGDMEGQAANLRRAAKKCKDAKEGRDQALVELEKTLEDSKVNIQNSEELSEMIKQTVNNEALPSS